MTNVIADEIIKWLGIFISVLLIYYGFRYQYSKAPLEKQLYNAYLPMFRLLEPYLYKQVDVIGYEKLNELVNEIDEIIDKHYELINPSIIHWTRMLKRSLNNSEVKVQEINKYYLYLCEKVDKEFEKTRRRMFLPIRNFEYRINNHQYESKTKLYFLLFGFAMPNLLILLGMNLLLYFLISSTE